MTRPVTTRNRTGVGPWRLGVRGVFHRCPVCGEHGFIRRWFWIEDRCPTCDLGYQRSEGQVVGSIGLNMMCSFASTFAVLLVGSIIMIPNIVAWPLILGCTITGGILPVVLLPSYRLAWCAIDLVLQPLQPHEVDPRFLIIDS